MKKIIAGIAFLSLTLLASCGGGSKPEDVAKKFVEANTTANYDEAKKYADSTTIQMIDMLAGFVPKDKQEEMKKKKVVVTIVSSEIEKDTLATVKYKLAMEGEEKGENTLNLKKSKGGDWKVTTNKEGKPGVPKLDPNTAPAPVADTTAVAPAQ